MAGEQWARVPKPGPGRDDPDKYGKRFRITHIVETLARHTGDVEAVAAVKKRDLSSPYVKRNGRSSTMGGVGDRISA